MEDKRKRIDELVELLEDANNRYYVQDDPVLTDQEYDMYYRELEELENRRRSNR